MKIEAENANENIGKKKDASEMKQKRKSGEKKAERIEQIQRK